MKFIKFLAVLALFCSSCANNTNSEATPKVDEAATSTTAEPLSFGYIGSTLDGKIVMANTLSNVFFVLELATPKQIPVQVLENATFAEVKSGVSLTGKNGKSYLFRLVGSEATAAVDNQEVMEGVGLLKIKHDDIAGRVLKQLSAGNYVEEALACACLLEKEKATCLAGGDGQQSCTQEGKYHFSTSATCAKGYKACCN